MRILWLPHLPWDFVRYGQREYHLIREIQDRHEFHILTWENLPRTPGRILRSVGSWSSKQDGLTIHHAPRVPNFMGRRVHQTGRAMWVNEWLYTRATREVVRRERIDLVLCGISHLAVGLPPANLPVPLVFDFLDFDLADHPHLERAYLERAEAVICTTKVLVERAEPVNPYCYYLPNGADVAALQHADPSRVRRQFGLDGQTVVSLIGAHCSDDLFFVDAIAAAASELPNITFMVVGSYDQRVQRIEQRGRELGLRVVATGLVPRSEVADYFAATDVGLFPGDQTPYFDACCPLKVLEYSAARKPVVATDLAELRNWAFPNVALVPPTASAFRQAIVQAMTQPQGYPDMSGFTWPVLGQQLLQILDEVAARGKWRQRTALGVAV